MSDIEGSMSISTSPVNPDMTKLKTSCKQLAMESHKCLEKNAEDKSKCQGKHHVHCVDYECGN